MRSENEFDLLVKNILESSAEKAPADAWRNIQGRLTGTGRKTSGGWWWLLAPAFCALAAIIVLNIPVVPTTSSDTTAESVCAGQVPTQSETAKTVELLPGTESDVLAMASTETSRADFNGISKLRHTAKAVNPAEISKTDDSSEKAAETSLASTEAEKETGTSVSATLKSVTTHESAEGTGTTATDKKTETASTTDNRISWNEFNRQEKPDRNKSGFRIDAKGAAGGNGNNFIAQAGKDLFGYGSGSGSSKIVETSESSYSVPFSVVIGGRLYFLPQLSLGAGISYSQLNRKFTGTYESSQEQQIQHTMHYIGIPVDIQFDFLKLHILNLYVNAGGQAEYCVANVYNIGGQRITEAVSGIQFSVNAGVGLEFKFTKHFGLFVTPGVKYFFNCNQPKSVRTEKPFNFQLDGGLRFTL